MLVVGVEMHNPVAFFINVRLLNFFGVDVLFFFGQLPAIIEILNSSTLLAYESREQSLT